MMGGALGLAVLASLAAARTESLAASGAALPGRPDGRLPVAFFVGAYSGGAALLSAALLAPDPPPGREGEERPVPAALARDLLPGKAPGATGATGFFGCLGSSFRGCCAADPLPWRVPR